MLMTGLAHWWAFRKKLALGDGENVNVTYILAGFYNILKYLLYDSNHYLVASSSITQPLD